MSFNRHLSQMSFKEGRICTDAVLTLKILVGKRREFNRENHTSFMVWGNVFDNVSRSLLRDIILKNYSLSKHSDSAFWDEDLLLEISNNGF